MEVLSLCPFRAGALAWQSAPNAWSLTVVVKATFAIVIGGEATVAPVQSPVAAFAGDAEAIEDLSPLKPKVDVLVIRGRNEDAATVEVSGCVLPARGPIPPYAPVRRLLLLREAALEWAAAVLRGEAASAGPAPDGFDFSFFHVAPRDQRVDLLRTGVPLVLNHVLPDCARAETILPQRKPQAFRIHPQTGKASEIILRCDTLCIDAARGLLVLTFRGIADIDAPSQTNTGTIVVAAHSAGKKIRADRIERFLRNGEPIEGESNDGRHPLEKRYDTVLAAPKGDTMALPEMDNAPAGVWQAAPVTHNDSGIMRAPALPFQSATSDAPPQPAPPALLSAPVGGRRKATLATPVEANRGPDMPFQGALPPPVPEAYLPPPPPEGIFPPPPALLAMAPPPEPPPLIRPPPMLGGSYTSDEKTADLPPGHAQPPESPEESTVDLPPHTAAATLRAQVPPPVGEAKRPAPVAPGLAGKPAPAAPKPPVAAPNAPKAIAVLGAGQAPKPAAAAPKPGAIAPAAPKPGAIAPAAPKPGAAPPKPNAPAAVAPKPAAPKAPLKVPAPLGPKLKTESSPKPNAAAPAVTAPAIEKKPRAATPEKPATPAPDKPNIVAADKPVAPAKPAALRPMTATLPFPGMVKPDTAAAIAAAIAAAPAPAKAPAPAESGEPFDAAGALTLEQCAALEAELRHRSDARKTLLQKNQLSDEQWAAVQKHWLDAIARQTEVGERKLLLAYDAAYVAMQERLGVQVGLDTHAKLQVAAERGTSTGVLKELGLEPTDQMRLGRVWTQRLADEPARMRELAAAIEKARAG